MGPNTAPTDDDGKDLELDKTNDKNKEDVENSDEEAEDEDESPDKINSEFNDNQESYFNNGTEEATIIGADTEVTNIEVSSSRHNNVEGPDENVGEKIKSKLNKEQTEEGKLNKVTKMKTNEYKNEIEQELNTETEEATNMGADTEVIGVSGLQKHAEIFHAKGAAALMRTEEVENSMTEAIDAKIVKDQPQAPLVSKKQQSKMVGTLMNWKRRIQ